MQIKINCIVSWIYKYPDMISRSMQVFAMKRYSTGVCNSARRMFAVAAPRQKKHEWIVILPDHEGVLEKRMQVRA